jgi:hypothetical protein
MKLRIKYKVTYNLYFFKIILTKKRTLRPEVNIIGSLFDFDIYKYFYNLNKDD